MARGHTVLFSADILAGVVRDLARSIDRDLAGSRLVVDHRAQGCGHVLV